MVHKGEANSIIILYYRNGEEEEKKGRQEIIPPSLPPSHHDFTEFSLCAYGGMDGWMGEDKLVL